MKNELIKIDNQLQNIDFSVMTNRDIADNLDMVKEALKRIEDIETQLKDEAKIRLMKGQSVKGYDLCKKKAPRKVKNLNQLYKILSEHNIDENIFIGACAVSLPQLETIYANVNNLISGASKKDLKAEFNKLIEELVEDGKTTTYVRKI